MATFRTNNQRQWLGTCGISMLSFVRHNYALTINTPESDLYEKQDNYNITGHTFNTKPNPLGIPL